MISSVISRKKGWKKNQICISKPATLTENRLFGIFRENQIAGFQGGSRTSRMAYEWLRLSVVRKYGTDHLT